MAWTAADLSDLHGKTVIVTGGNSGIGFAAARQLVRKGAQVVLACRDRRRADAAVADLRRELPGGTVEVGELDLASLASVRRFAENFASAHPRLDVLCNNAGVMALPYARTADGFEMQFGVNHLGHFALTGLLLQPLLATPGARVVSVSSGAHRAGRIRFDDLDGERRYSKWLAYGQSKLANLLFTFELQRRLAAARTSAISVACHPGYAATNLQYAGPRLLKSSLLESVWRLANGLAGQSADMGALPTLYAATSPQLTGGEYVGPDGMGELWGNPKIVGCSAAARDAETARRLWDVSVQRTGVDFAALRPSRDA